VFCVTRRMELNWDLTSRRLGLGHRPAVGQWTRVEVAVNRPVAATTATVYAFLSARELLWFVLLTDCELVPYCLHSRSWSLNFVSCSESWPVTLYRRNPQIFKYHFRSCSFFHTSIFDYNFSHLKRFFLEQFDPRCKFCQQCYVCLSENCGWSSHVRLRADIYVRIICSYGYL